MDIRMDDFKPNQTNVYNPNMPNTNGNNNGLQNNERLNLDKNNLNGGMIPQINLQYDNPQELKNPPLQGNNPNYNNYINLNNGMNSGMAVQQPTIQQPHNTIFKNQLMNGMNPIHNNTVSPQVINEKDNVMYYESNPMMSPIKTYNSQNPSPLALYGSSEAVQSASWFPSGSPKIAAGMAMKYIRIYDVKSNGSNAPSIVISTKSINGVCVDPFNHNRLASFGDDGIIKIWDIRYINHNNDALISINSEYKQGISQILWSPIRSGFLAACGNNSQYLNLWNIQEGITKGSTGSLNLNTQSFKFTNTAITLNNNNLDATQNINEITNNVNESDNNSLYKVANNNNTNADMDNSNTSQNNTDLNKHPNNNANINNNVNNLSVIKSSKPESTNIPIMWKMRQVKSISSGAITTFAWIPTSLNSASCSQRVIAVVKDSIIEVLDFNEPFKMKWHPLGGLTCSNSHSLTMYDTTSRPDINDNNIKKLNSQHIENLLNQPSNIKIPPNAVPPLQLMQNDISVIMRDRAIAGYSMDIAKNLNIPGLTNDLIDLWSWLNEIKNLSHNGKTILDGKNYALMGILSIINERKEPSQKINVNQKAETSKRRLNKTYASAVSQNINKNDNMNYPDKKNLALENRPYSEQDIMTEQERRHLHNRLNLGNSEINPNYLYQNYSPNLVGRNEYDENMVPQGRPYNPNSMQNLVLDQSAVNSPVSYSLNEQHQQQRIIQLYQNSDLPFPIYYSPERQLALKLCGWDSGNDQPEVEEAIQSLERVGEFEKAAGWAIFHLSSLERAIKALNSSNYENHKLVATALAGFTNNNNNSNNVWKELCKSLSFDLVDPYLRSIFRLLSNPTGNEKDSWNVILNESGLSLSDRVAIALRFLNDNDLNNYLKDIASYSINNGNLEGLLLTGLTPLGIDLFEQYINKTGDIQTTCLVLSQVVPKVFTSSKVVEWVENYRLLLDRWQLFHIRVYFDIARRKITDSINDELSNQMNNKLTLKNQNNNISNNSLSTISVPSQIYVRCNFCNQSITHNLLNSNKANGPNNAPGNPNVLASAAPTAGGAAGATTPSAVVPKQYKPSACPNCRKALPRCSLCMLLMGTPIDTLQNQRKGNHMTISEYEESQNSFNYWFTWCQSCFHGGHAIHMMEWFENHDECPVSNCTCKCNILE